MYFAPQEVRTFFVTFATSQRAFLLQSDRLCELFVDVLRSNREKKRFAVHEFVIMPNHVHLLLTPAPENSLEKAIQLIKGGFSFRASREMNVGGEIWHKGFNEHRVKDAFDYEQHVRYIRENPVRAGLATRAEDFPFSTARLKAEADPAPGHLLRVSGQQSPA